MGRSVTPKNKPKSSLASSANIGSNRKISFNNPTERKTSKSKDRVRPPPLELAKVSNLQSPFVKKKINEARAGNPAPNKILDSPRDPNSNPARKNYSNTYNEKFNLNSSEKKCAFRKRPIKDGRISGRSNSEEIKEEFS